MTPSWSWWALDVGRVLMVVAITGLSACSRAPQAPVEIAFDFARNQIVVPVQIQGREQACLLDTGTNPSGIDAKLAEELKLTITGPAGKADGVGTEDVTIEPTSFDVSLGGAAASRVEAVAIDLSGLSKRMGRPIGCILGQSWLTTRVVQIDYPKKVVRVGGSTPSEGCESFPMKYWVADDAMPLVEVRVLDGVYPVTLDTGSSETVKLFLKDAPPAGFDLSAVPKAVAGFRGEASVIPARVSLVVFGPISLQDLKVSLGDRNQGEPPGARMGNLGNGVLQTAC